MTGVQKRGYHETLDSHWYHYRNCTDSSSRSASKKEAKIMGLLHTIRTYRKYQSFANEVDDLVSTMYESVKDGKISKEDKSICLKKYWNLLKAIEKA